MNIVDYKELLALPLKIKSVPHDDILLKRIKSGESLIVKNLPDTIYHSIETHLGSTKIINAFKSMEHMESYVPKSKSSALYQAFHCILLEGRGEFTKKFTFLNENQLKEDLTERLNAIDVEMCIVADKKPTKTEIKEAQKGVNITNLKKERKEFYRTNGVTVLSETDYKTAKEFQECQEKRSNSLLNTFIENGISELSFFCKDPVTGLLLKGRGDNVNLDKGIITDLKGLLSPSSKTTEHTISRMMQTKGYLWQACHYLYILKIITDKDFTFLHFIHENAAPYTIFGAKYEEDSFTQGGQILLEKYKEIKAYMDNPKEVPQEQLIEIRHWFDEKQEFFDESGCEND